MYKYELRIQNKFLVRLKYSKLQINEFLNFFFREFTTNLVYNFKLNLLKFVICRLFPVAFKMYLELSGTIWIVVDVASLDK